MSSSANILSYDELKRARNKAKAGRAFSRLYESPPSDASQSSSRPALYRAEMGRSQRKATRMQNAGAGQVYGGMHGGSGRTAATAEPFSFLSLIPAGFSKKFFVAMGIIACVCILVICVYPAAQQFYVSSRQHDQLEAEARAVAERTENLAAEIEYLKTESGIEAAARESLGWIKEGENAVEVYGLPASVTQKTSNADTVIASGSVPAPETWYSPFLDVIFGYDALT